VLARNALDICIFTHLAREIKTRDHKKEGKFFQSENTMALIKPFTRKVAIR